MKINIEYVFDIAKAECTASTIVDGDKLMAVADRWQTARIKLLQSVRTYMLKPPDEVEIEIEPEPEPEPEKSKPARKVKKK